MRKTERILLNEYGVDKVIDARNMWFVYYNPMDKINGSFEEMEERFLFLDMGEIDYEDGFYSTMSLAQTKKVIEIMQGYVDYYEEFKERKMKENENE